MIHVLIACSLALSSILKYVPKGALFGVFLYMGITSIAGNQLFDRVFLLMNFEPRTYPRLPYVTRLTTKRLHIYTIIQFLCLVILYGLKAEKRTAIAFPFFIALLVFVRLGLGWFFTKAELDVLDAEDDLPPDPPEPAKKLDDDVAGKHPEDRKNSKGSNGDLERTISQESVMSKHSKLSESPDEAVARLRAKGTDKEHIRL
jgi:hypothetical protein